MVIMINPENKGPSVKKLVGMSIFRKNFESNTHFFPVITNAMQHSFWSLIIFLWMCRRRSFGILKAQGG